MGTELAHGSGTFINFRDYPFPDPLDHGYRWVDAKYLHLPAEPTHDRDLLTAAIAHELFRDNYAGGDVDPQGTCHGSTRPQTAKSGASSSSASSQRKRSAPPPDFGGCGS